MSPGKSYIRIRIAIQSKKIDFNARCVTIDQLAVVSEG